MEVNSWALKQWRNFVSKQCLRLPASVSSRNGPLQSKRIRFCLENQSFCFIVTFNCVFIGKRCGTSQSDHITSVSINTSDSLEAPASWSSYSLGTSSLCSLNQFQDNAWLSSCTPPFARISPFLLSHKGYTIFHCGLNYSERLRRLEI